MPRYQEHFKPLLNGECGEINRKTGEIHANRRSRESNLDPRRSAGLMKRADPGEARNPGLGAPVTAGGRPRGAPISRRAICERGKATGDRRAGRL